jgi:hypothetical protein
MSSGNRGHAQLVVATLGNQLSNSEDKAKLFQGAVDMRSLTRTWEVEFFNPSRELPFAPICARAPQHESRNFTID